MPSRRISLRDVLHRAGADLRTDILEFQRRDKAIRAELRRQRRVLLHRVKEALTTASGVVGLAGDDDPLGRIADDAWPFSEEEDADER